MQARICYDCATRLAITTTAPCKDCQPRHATSAPFIPDSVSQITAARVSDINESTVCVLLPANAQGAKCKYRALFAKNRQWLKHLALTQPKSVSQLAAARVKNISTAQAPKVILGSLQFPKTSKN